MKRKAISCFLCGLCLLYCFLGFVPMRGYAIVPVSLVESALASYTVSAGYKWYSDGSGSEMSQSITNLYNTWLQVTDPVAAIKTLEQFAENDYVYLDSSGQIVIRKAAADMFQQFADWIETQYSVPVGSDTPTEVQSATVGGFTFPAYQTTGYIDVSSVYDDSVSFYRWFMAQSATTYVVSSSVESAILAFLNQHDGEIICLSAYQGNGRYDGYSPLTITAGPVSSRVRLGYSSADYTSLTTYGSGNNGTINLTNTQTQSYVSIFYGYQKVSYDLSACNINIVAQPGVSGLGVTIAQAVADVVGQATDDDVVVIGVGAGVGATAQDIASLVADGIKAGTLDPSVSITAEAVIDTPVQPYPDIDGLGLPSLGAELVSRFPFCIPWDFVDVVKLFSAEPVAPRFQFDIVPSRVKTFCNISQSTTIDLNMGDPKFEKIGVFCRWGSLIGFCWGLVLLTKRMIWTA